MTTQTFQTTTWRKLSVYARFAKKAKLMCLLIHREEYVQCIMERKSVKELERKRE